jgi:uncharacterized protein (DUF934 family)
MAVINTLGHVIADDWLYPGTQHFLCSPKVIHRLDKLSDAIPTVRPFGVLLSPEPKIEPIVQLLNRLDLVAIEFPDFMDGRGFTIARCLREQHAFRGDIRASGHLLPDQFAALIQCGFTSIVTPPDHPPLQWQNIVTPPSAGTVMSVPLLRRLLNGCGGAKADHNGVRRQ